MEKYVYKIKTPTGEVIKDIMYASSYDDLNKLISSTGSTLISCRKYKKKKEILVKKIRSDTLALFCQKISIMLASGITLIESIKIINDNITDKKLKFILNEVVKDLQMGSSFYSAVEKYDEYFPRLFKMMIKVSEISGKTSEIMDYLSNFYMKEYRIKQKVRSSMIYPIILFIVSIIVFLALIFLVIPQFENTFVNLSSSKIPKVTTVVFNTARFIRVNFIYILLVILFLVLVISILINLKNSYIKDYLKLKIPIFGKINSYVITSTFTRSIAMMYLGGISLSSAFEETIKIIDNLYLKKKLESVLNNILKGKSLALSLKEIKFFPVMMIEMLSIGENSNKLSHVLKQLSDYYDNESDTAISKMTQFIEPFIIIFVALIISIVILAIFMPMFGMMDSIMEV